MNRFTIHFYDEDPVDAGSLADAEKKILDNVGKGGPDPLRVEEEDLENWNGDEGEPKIINTYIPIWNVELVNEKDLTKEKEDRREDNHDNNCACHTQV